MGPSRCLRIFSALLFSILRDAAADSLPLDQMNRTGEGGSPHQSKSSTLGIPLNPNHPHARVDAIPEVLRPLGISAALLTHQYLQVITEYWKQEWHIIDRIELFPNECFTSISMIVTPQTESIPAFTSETVAWGMRQAFDATIDAGADDEDRRDLNRYKIVLINSPTLVLGHFQATTNPGPQVAPNLNHISQTPPKSDLVAREAARLNDTMNRLSRNVKIHSDFTGTPMAIKDVLLLVKEMAKAIWQFPATRRLPRTGKYINVYRRPTNMQMRLNVFYVGTDPDPVTWTIIADGLKQIMAVHVTENRWESMTHTFLDEHGESFAEILYFHRGGTSTASNGTEIVDQDINVF